MLRKLGLLVLVSLFLGGCDLIPQKSGIEVVSNPTAKIIIGGKDAGMTPYKNNSLKPGENEIIIRTIDGKQEWKRKIYLQNFTTTVVQREFGAESENSGGYVLFMEKTGDSEKAGIIVNSNIDKSSVFIDGEMKGFTPMKVENIGEGDREVLISFPSYKTINVFVKAAKGYRLVIDAELAVDSGKNLTSEFDKTIEEENTLSNLVDQKKIKILETETGWLRVRSGATASAGEIAKVKPGEEYVLVSEQEGWYQIDLGDSKLGWISSSYAEKVGE